MQLSESLLALAATKPLAPLARQVKPPALAPGVLPAGSLALDSAYVALDSQQIAPLYSWANQNGCGLGFPGYAYLSELAQRSEYRSPAETIAKEMTRRWIEFRTDGDGDHSARIKKIEEAFTKLGVQESFRRLAEQDALFGRSQLYVCIDGQMDDDSRRLPLVVDKATIKKGSLLGFKTVEAIWTTPYSYNAVDPTASDFFKPRAWYVLGKETHASRLLTFTSREVPDLLKPAYNFGGISMSQLMEPYVIQWLRTRDSISDLIHNFSVLVLSTNMQATLEGGAGDELFKRMQLFTQSRDNRGLMTLDKDSEELTQIAVPLSGLEGLQAQAQEHMAAPSHIPLVKLLGITPTGLNASSDGEIKVFYDFVRAEQKSFFGAHLATVLRIVQLHLFGDIDEGITFEFVPLEEPNGTELAQQRKSDADAGVAYINAGVVSADEERERLSSDPNSGYDNLSGPAPEPPVEPDDEGTQAGAQDEWNESAHSRAENGQFGGAGLYLVARGKQDELNAAITKLSRRLDGEFPASGPMGARTDETKRNPAYVALKGEVDAALARLQAFNAYVNKTFSAEQKAYRRANPRGARSVPEGT